MPMMKVELRVGETLRFDGEGAVAVRLVQKSGQRARLEVDADESIIIRPPRRRRSARDYVKEGIGVT